jgi:RimJ/RimL family protein N-acetyltransferase/uncharacterized damage-inducible protein DinB
VLHSWVVGEIFLETERLVLRRFTQSDVDKLVELDSDPEVMRFLTGGKPTPREVIRDEVLPKILGYHEKYGDLGHWAAEEKSTGDFVGWFALEPTKGPEDVELGYRLRRSAWGKGYATEGARALVRKAFTELGVRRVYAETMTVNTGSRRVMAKAGLRYRRTFHLSWPEPIEGTEQGDVEYALTKAEWDGPDLFDGPATDVADPRELLIGYLDWYREALMRKVAGLSEEQLRTPVQPMGWSPLGLIKHLGWVERRWMRWGFAAEDVPPRPPGGDEAEWAVGAGESTESVLSAYAEEVGRSRAMVAGAQLTDTAAVGGRFPTAEVAPTLVRILFHLLQEYARHAGHLDIAREMVDGRVGE